MFERQPEVSVNVSAGAGCCASSQPDAPARHDGSAGKPFFLVIDN
jgi:hypothetical protein